MPEPTALELLFQKYVALDTESVRRLTSDQKLSLRYFKTELVLRQTPSATPVDRIGRWAHRVIAVEKFLQHEHRLPRENNRLPRGTVSADEQRLADWIRYQRRPATRSLHCDYQRRRLETLPGFSWIPLDDQWNERFADFAAFVAKHHRPPRYRSDNSDERAIAAWVTKQRRFIKLGTLPADRVRKLNSLSFRHTVPAGDQARATDR